jgi:chromosome segregation ATPase
VRRRVLVCEGEVAQAERELEKLEGELEVSRRELEEVKVERARKTSVEADYSGEIARLDSECAEAEASIERIELELETLSARADGAKDDASEARVALGKVENEDRNLREFFDKHVRNLDDQKSRCADLREASRLSEERISQTRNEQVDSRARLLELGERETGLVDELNKFDESEQALAREEDAIRRQCESVRVRISEHTERKQSISLKDQEERHRRETALDRIEEEYGLDL